MIPISGSRSAYFKIKEKTKAFLWDNNDLLIETKASWLVF